MHHLEFYVHSYDRKSTETPCRKSNKSIRVDSNNTVDSIESTPTTRERNFRTCVSLVTNENENDDDAMSELCIYY
jgi:hypothetical protein